VWDSTNVWVNSIKLVTITTARHKPFVAAVQHVQAARRQIQGQSWYHRHILALVAVMLTQASLLLDAAPT